MELIDNEWRELLKHAGRTTASHKIKEVIFISNLPNIFEIAHADALNIIKLEEDKQFLINRWKLGRPGFMYRVDYEMQRKIKKIYKTLELCTIQIVSFVLLKLTKNQPRDDYRDLLVLTLFFLGNGTKRYQSFRLPGAYHHARWMAMAIYCLKMYLFRYEFKLTKAEEKRVCDISIFLVFVYIWIMV